jgi:hypothetical protein
MRKGKRETKANSPLSNNGAQSVTLDMAITLMIAFSYYPCFIALNRPIGIALDVEDPFVAKNIHGGIWRHERPCAIANKGAEFFHHSSPPFGIFWSLTRAGRLNIIHRVGKKTRGNGMAGGKKYLGPSCTIL